MAKATLSYTLPEEAPEFNCAKRGHEYLAFIMDFTNELREKVKYTETVPKSWEEVQDMWFDLLKSYSIDPYGE